MVWDWRITVSIGCVIGGGGGGTSFIPHETEMCDNSRFGEIEIDLCQR